VSILNFGCDVRLLMLHIAAFAGKNDEMMKNIPVISVDDSVKGLLNQIDNSSREKTGGMFMNYDGRIRNW
jgi:hypothetical protein